MSELTTSQQYMLKLLAPYWEKTLDRFWSKVEITESCWVWLGTTTNGGYGMLQPRRHFAGRYRMAHRFAYELMVGPIPDGLVLDHLCRNAACVRPDHLEPVTYRENTLRGNRVGAAANAFKTHCAKGHEYDLLNTAVYAGRRECKACRKAQRATPRVKARMALAAQRWRERQKQKQGFS